MSEPVWKEVTKDELIAFVRAYPRPLSRDCTGICDPPMESWNDFSDGKVWPESMVAKVSRADLMGMSEEELKKYGFAQRYWVKELSK